MEHLFHLVRDRCVTDPWQLLALVTGNAWIAYSYLRIPVVLRRISWRLPLLAPGRREIRGFALFVASCGVTHLFTVAVLFLPSLDLTATAWMYWTGFISWLVARRLKQAEAAIIQAIDDATVLASRLDDA